MSECRSVGRQELHRCLWGWQSANQTVVSDVVSCCCVSRCVAVRCRGGGTAASACCCFPSLRCRNHGHVDRLSKLRAGLSKHDVGLDQHHQLSTAPHVVDEVLLLLLLSACDCSTVMCQAMRDTSLPCGWVDVVVSAAPLVLVSEMCSQCSQLVTVPSAQPTTVSAPRERLQQLSPVRSLISQRVC